VFEEVEVWCAVVWVFFFFSFLISLSLGTVAVVDYGLGLWCGKKVWIVVRNIGRCGGVVYHLRIGGEHCGTGLVVGLDTLCYAFVVRRRSCGGVSAVFGERRNWAAFSVLDR
jgi:hypothetical protein